MHDYKDNPLDQEVNTEFMRVCKCIVPYLDTSLQKNVAIGLKFLELMNTINAFSENSTFSTNLALTRQQGRWEQELLKDVRSNLSPEKAYIIDALIKFQEFKSILNTKDHYSNTPFPENVDYSSKTPPPFSSGDSTFDHSFETFSPETPPPPPPFEEFERSENTNNTSDNNAPPPQSTPPSPASMIQMLSPLLDENQRQMLNLFTSFLGTK